jgi:hypothetical protein
MLRRALGQKESACRPALIDAAESFRERVQYILIGLDNHLEDMRLHSNLLLTASIYVVGPDFAEPTQWIPGCEITLHAGSNTSGSGFRERSAI